MSERNYAELMRSFELMDIDPKDFGHIDHIGVAYEMLRTYDFIEATNKYATCINTIATRAGASRKFNTTITIAYLGLIAERIKETSHETFDEFIERNQDLLASDLLMKWYSAERLQSDLARSVFLLPDIAA